MTTNAAVAATPAPSTSSVSGESQPHVAASCTASTVAPRPPTSSANAPARIRPGRVACAGLAIATSTSAAIPTGTFSQNTARHDTDSVSAPPINGPIARKIWLIPA